MIKFLKFLFLLFSVVLLSYLLLPNPDFPNPPPDAVQSDEPGDTETSLRRAYFTDLGRARVMDWYKTQMKWGYRLNYPPEEAQTIIRDQTRSTFLEEIVHPFRESVYVNGFEPAPDDEKNAINIDGRHFRQKIIIRYVPSSVIVRVLMWAGVTMLSVILFKAWGKTWLKK